MTKENKLYAVIAISWAIIIVLVGINYGNKLNFLGSLVSVNTAPGVSLGSQLSSEAKQTIARFMDVKPGQTILCGKAIRNSVNEEFHFCDAADRAAKGDDVCGPGTLQSNGSIAF